MQKKKILVVCVHNSARSQMAEAYFNLLGNDKVVAESAGLSPGQLNPYVVQVMREDSLDISHHKTQSVSVLLDRNYDYIITVCDGANSARCPVFPGHPAVLHWPFEDPSSLDGTEEGFLTHIRIIRDAIKGKITTWLTTL